MHLRPVRAASRPPRTFKTLLLLALEAAPAAVKPCKGSAAVGGCVVVVAVVAKRAKAIR